MTVCSRSSLVELGAVLPATGKLVVARLDGAKLTDAETVFYEFSDALLFPGYFGWNWDALSDCLRDLHWLPADAYLIVVERAPLLMSGNPAERQTLLQILSRAARAWADPLDRPYGGERVVIPGGGGERWETRARTCRRPRARCR